MSWLSDAVRGVTGGYGIGQTAGAAVGGLVGFGSPTAIATGARIGGAITERIDMDRTEGQATARDISPNLPQETGMSGAYPMYSAPSYPNMRNYGAPQPVQQGFMGVGSLIGQGTRFLQTPGGAAAAGGMVGAAADFVIDLFTGQQKKLVVTRKMQREIKELYMYMNGDLGAVAQAYSAYKGISLSVQQVQMILLKKFRNDGPYVTKAAVRKTRATVRKLERLEALKKQICGTRAAPRRRATTSTRISKVTV